MNICKECIYKEYFEGGWFDVGIARPIYINEKHLCGRKKHIITGRPILGCKDERRYSLLDKWFKRDKCGSEGKYFKRNK